MIRKASFLVAITLSAFLAGACITTAFLSATAEGSQTKQHLDPIPSLNMASEVRLLAFQPAVSSNSTQANRPLAAENMTRIIVPISRVENTSSGGTQPFNGFVFPTWLWVLVILVLLVILAYLFVRLLREGDEDVLADKRPLAPTSASGAQSQQSRHIPISEAEIEAERKKGSLSAEGQPVRSIPIDTREEVQKPEDKSK